MLSVFPENKGFINIHFCPLLNTFAGLKTTKSECAGFIEEMQRRMKSEKKQKPLRLLHLVNGLAVGGGEKKLWELVRCLNKDYRAEYEQVVCSVGQGGPLDAAFRELDLPLHIYPKRFSFDLGLVSKVMALIRQNEIDIVQTTLFYADIIGAAAAALTRGPKVVSWEVYTQQHPLHHRFAYWLTRASVDTFVAVSEATRQDMIRTRNIDPKRVLTIQYGVDLNGYQKTEAGAAIRHQLGLSADSILVGVVARFTEQKGHTYLLDAMPEIIRKAPSPVQFVFLGDGPLKASLQAKAESLGVNRVIHYPGFVDNVAEWLAAFDLFVLPSLYEGLPNALLEAMAASNPVVATAVDGSVEAVVEGETGYLVPSRDPEKLRDRILLCIRNPEIMRQMGTNGRKRVEDHFSLEKQVGAFHELYQKLGE